MSHASPEDWALIWGAEVSSTNEADPGRAIIEAFWRREFSIIPAIDRALEIGAGGSATVAKLMTECFANAEIIASDFRDGPALPGAIAYVGNASLEAMPFADGHFDLIAGQFAFEYANAQKAGAELSRILRCGGRLKLLVHHAESNFSVTLPHRERCLQAGVLLQRALTRRMRSCAKSGSRHVEADHDLDRILSTATSDFAECAWRLDGFFRDCTRPPRRDEEFDGT